MREMWGDFWTVADQLYPYAGLLIPTNGVVNKHGRLVMGAGLARQAANRHPNLPLRWGRHVAARGNTPHLLKTDDRWFWSLPTKYHWRDQADLELIIESAKDIADTTTAWAQSGTTRTFLLPRVGCGLGQLDWGIVRAVLDPIFDDHFIAVSVEP